MVIQNPTYFTTDGVDYGVLALTLTELEMLSDALDAADGTDASSDLHDVILEAMHHLEGREEAPNAL